MSRRSPKRKPIDHPESKKLFTAITSVSNAIDMNDEVCERLETALAALIEAETLVALLMQHFALWKEMTVDPNLAAKISHSYAGLGLAALKQSIFEALFMAVARIVSGEGSDELRLRNIFSIQEEKIKEIVLE